MSSEALAARLHRVASATGSLLCLGLDPPAAPLTQVERHCRRLLDGALGDACAVKANLAFFEQLGPEGMRLLVRLRGLVPADRLLIADGKRGDIGWSAEAYARALFDVLGADAVTVNPLMGRDAVGPFLRREGRGAFLLTRTSNPGAADLLTEPLAGGERVYERIVRLGVSWDPGGRGGFVVGATDPAAVRRVRELAPAAPLLLPGVGAQGGDLEEAVAAGLDGAGTGLLVSVSRGIAEAPEGVARAAGRLRERVEAVRASSRASGPPRPR